MLIYLRVNVSRVNTALTTLGLSLLKVVMVLWPFNSLVMVSDDVFLVCLTSR